MNTCYYEIYYISLEMVWWASSNTSSIVQICLAIHKISVNEAFTVTDGLISWLFVIAFVNPAYMQIAFIWGFLAQLSLWKSVYWLWRYKLNKVYDSILTVFIWLKQEDIYSTSAKDITITGIQEGIY